MKKILFMGVIGLFLLGRPTGAASIRALAANIAAATPDA